MLRLFGSSRRTAAPASEPKTFSLHLGLAKTGTTYLQGLLADHRPALRASGTIYPFIWPEGMFHAAVDVVGQYDQWAIPKRRRRGAWDALVSRAEDFDGNALLSHEILALATADQAQNALARLSGYQVELVLTVRDLARQFPAYWQESVKNGATHSFAEFAEAAASRPRSAENQFWFGQDVIGVLDRWGAHLPADRIHIVTCPPPGTPATTIWERFAAAAQIPAEVVDADRPPANESLGCAQIRLLRSLNSELTEELTRERYIHVVKRMFAQNIVNQTEPARQPRTPGEFGPVLASVTQEWVAAIRDRGYQVHGDLADLWPASFTDGRHPDDVTDREAAAIAPAYTAELLRAYADLRDKVH